MPEKLPCKIPLSRGTAIGGVYQGKTVKIMKKRILLVAIAIAAVAFGVVGMSAFEAHVINVTATIENALNIPVTPINYGTVFPQEQLDRQITVALSDSFSSEGKVDDVS